MPVPLWLTLAGETVVRRHHGRHVSDYTPEPRRRGTSERMIDRSRVLRSSACSERGGSPQVSGKLLIGLLGMMGCEPANPTRPDRKCRERHSSRPASCFSLVFEAGKGVNRAATRSAAPCTAHPEVLVSHFSHECNNTKGWLICQKPFERGGGSLWSECTVTGSSSCCGSF